MSNYEKALELAKNQRREGWPHSSIDCWCGYYWVYVTGSVQALDEAVHHFADHLASTGGWKKHLVEYCYGDGECAKANE